MSTTQGQSELNADLATLKRKSVSGAISYFMRTLLLQAIGLGSAIILSWLLSPEDFGIYGFVIQIIGILTFISDIGFAAALIQKKDEPSLLDYRTAFTVQQLLSWVIVLLSLLVIFSGFVSQKTGAVGNWLLLSVAISFPLASLKTISSVILERKLEFSKLVVPQIIEQLLFHSVLIGLAWKGAGAMAYTYAIFIRSVVGTAAMLVIQPWKIGVSFNKKSFLALIGFGAKFQINDFLARIKDQLFFLALGIVLPLREFGYVQWAKNWSLYPYMLTVQNVMAVTFPTFSRLQHDEKLLSRAIEKSLYFISLLLYPILVGMIVFIDPLLELVPAYQKWSPATFTFIWFAASVFWSAISTPLTNTLNAIGKINTTLKLMIMWTILTWILTPVGLLIWGQVGVAFSAFLISCSSAITVILVQRQIPFRFLWSIGSQSVAALSMLCIGLIGSSLWNNTVLSLISGMIITTTTYSMVFLVMGKDQFRIELASLQRLRSKN